MPPLDLGAIEQALPHLSGSLDCAALANRRVGEEMPIDSDPYTTTRVVRAIDLVTEAKPGHLRLDFHVKSALYKQVCVLNMSPVDCPPRGWLTRYRGCLPTPEC